MNWIAATVVVLSVVLWCTRGKRRTPTRRDHQKPAVEKSLDDDTIESVLREGSLQEWIAIAEKRMTPELKVKVLEKIIGQAYKERFKPEMHALVRQFGPVWSDLIETQAAQAKIKGMPLPNAASVFKWLAIALEEAKQVNEAIKVCEKAIRLGFGDGIKGGFQGRIDRLTQKRRAQPKADPAEGAHQKA